MRKFHQFFHCTKRVRFTQPPFPCIWHLFIISLDDTDSLPPIPTFFKQEQGERVIIVVGTTQARERIADGSRQLFFLQQPTLHFDLSTQPLSTILSMRKHIEG